MSLGPSRPWILPTLLIGCWLLLARAWFVGPGWLPALAFAVLALGLLLTSVWTSLGAFGPIVLRGRPGRRQVALTFDDGPDPAWTPQILDALADAGARATFFLVGERVERNPELARRLVAAGHQVAHHSHTHRWDLMFWRPRLVADVDAGLAALQAATDRIPRFFRPPIGILAPEVLDAARSRGMQLVGWSVRPYDTRLRSADELVRRVLSKVRDGSIVLLHDGAMRPGFEPPAVGALPVLLGELERRGLRAVTLAELIDQEPYQEEAPVRQTPRWSKVPLAVAVTLVSLIVGTAALAAPATASSPTAVSAPADLATAAAELAKNDQVKSTFQQTKTSVLFSEDVVRTGSLLLRRADGRLVWAYDDGPAMLMAGGRFYPAGVDAESAGVDGAAGYALPGGGRMVDVFEALFSLDAAALAASFDTTPVAPGHFALVPKDTETAALFSRVELQVGGEPLALRRVVMHEATGDRTVIEFSEVQVNGPLPEGAFLTPAERSQKAK